MIRLGYVDTPSGQVHYRTVPGAGTPLVMLHQTAGSSAMYDTMMGRLAGTRPLFALDTPGFGASFALPADDQPMSRYASWLLAALDGLGITRCHLLGHHTGGCIALEMAALDPGRFESITVIGPVYLTAEQRADYQGRYADATIVPEETGAYLLENWDHFKLLTGDANVPTRHRETIDYLRAWKARAPTYRAVWRSDQEGLYAAVRCPLLVMCARDDVLWPCFEALRSRLPDARTIEVVGGNHEPDVDPDGCSAGVTAIMAEAAP